MGKSSSAPAPVDYKGAATATAAGNRVSQYTPFGSLQYSADGKDTEGNPLYRSTSTLNPQDQATIDSARSLLGNSLGNAQQDWSKIPGLYGDAGSQQQSIQQAQDASYHKQTSLLDPQYKNQQDQLTAQLANQGVTQGSEAYTHAMDDFGRQRDFAYGQARDSAIGQGNSLQSQLFGQNLAAHQTGAQDWQTKINTPQNLINAIRTGGLGLSGTPGGADYLGASKAQGQQNNSIYSANVASDNANNSTTASLASAAAMLYFFGASDIRLKSNIVRIGTHKLGIGIYEYDIFGRRERGVMAQELEKVMPDAVVTHPYGYKMVNYGKL